MSTKDELDAIRDRLDALEAKAPAVTPNTGGLFAFVRPIPSAPRHGLGSRMDGPDLWEAVKRACSGVNYQGTLVHNAEAEDDVWQEIERLKIGDPELLPKYQALDPAFAGFALLTGLIDVAKWDPLGFGINAGKRDNFAKRGTTITSWLEDQFRIGHGGPGIGGE